MVQWSELCALTAEGPCSTPGWGTKVLWATPYSQKKKEVVYNYILYVQNTEEKLNMLNRDKKDLKKIQFKLLKIKIILNGICGRFDTAKKIFVYLNIQQ